MTEPSHSTNEKDDTLKPVQPCTVASGQHSWLPTTGSILQCYSCPMCKQCVYWSEIHYPMAGKSPSYLAREHFILCYSINIMARPTKYSPKILKLTKEYLKTIDTIDPNSPLPTIERLCIILDISKDTLYAWEDKHEEFSYVLRELRLFQADKLIQNSLIGKYNGLITKLMLSKHGYIEKTESDVTTGGDKIQPSVVIYRPEKLNDDISEK